MSAIPAAVRHPRRGIRLAEIDTRSTPGFDGDKAAGQAMLAERAAHLAQLQERLFAASSSGGGTSSVLLLLQGMDTAGKGGLVRHVVGAVDPQGVRITSFKRPTPAERRHDFLWRIERALPQPGQIGVFDRSHYEDVLIHRVRGLSKPETIEQRYGRIVDFERQLGEQGIRLVKVMPHISYGEQGARLLERLDRADKHWKYNPGDVDERTLWDEYQLAYKIAIDRTTRAAAPWHVVPADRKWYARLAVQELLIEALEDIDPQWPTADYDVDAERERLVALGGIPEAALAESAAASVADVAEGTAADAAIGEQVDDAFGEGESTSQKGSKQRKGKHKGKHKGKGKGKGKSKGDGKSKGASEGDGKGKSKGDGKAKGDGKEGKAKGGGKPESAAEGSKRTEGSKGSERGTAL